MDFDAHALRTRQDVLVVQEVERSARSEEFLIARHRSRLGGESIHREPSLAEAGGGRGAIMEISSIQAAVDLGQFVIQIADLEIAPHPIILAIARFDVELAHGWGHFLHDTIVAERRIIIVWIDAPE